MAKKKIKTWRINTDINRLVKDGLFIRSFEVKADCLEAAIKIAKRETLKEIATSLNALNMGEVL